MFVLWLFFLYHNVMRLKKSITCLLLSLHRSWYLWVPYRHCFLSVGPLPEKWGNRAMLEYQFQSFYFYEIANNSLCKMNAWFNSKHIFYRIDMYLVSTAADNLYKDNSRDSIDVFINAVTIRLLNSIILSM